MNVPNDSLLHKRFHKSNESKYLSQEKIFYEFLLTGWFTARQVEAATGITISNCTLYKRDLEKAGKLWTSVDKTFCSITGKKAKVITTNRNLVPQINDAIQSKLF